MVAIQLSNQVINFKMHVLNKQLGIAIETLTKSTVSRMPYRTSAPYVEARYVFNKLRY